jgi:hypothetical protein
MDVEKALLPESTGKRVQMSDKIKRHVIESR